MISTDTKQINTDLLFNDLTYKIRGAIFTVLNKYGKGLKEIIYQKALAEEFEKLNIKFEQQKRINIYSVDTGYLKRQIYTNDRKARICVNP